ncbi:aldo/keto reductase [Pseudosulfitobacter sp. DSM 107133]|uniref:aldo/keto reductase n=1 Tax=Pseudosulfitobacter sp. DSM 107133 TaxID=2883100 RepID=UPI000DF30F59|nr:aldo/keto reductase [Pseudosulfitobacter sp. DSM 107133]UOA27958.1 Aldo-keto reductase IolS [Pseudosulfitobacter sp. DSM 107133]
MKMRKLGAQGPEISALGIGAMSFANFYGAATEAGSHAILDLARDLGVTHIDTSNVYGMGQSESFIGSYLAANPGARDDFHIATKAAITRDSAGNRHFDNSPAHFESELDKSLSRLGLDHVDLYYCHRRQADVPIEEVTGTLDALRQKGKIKAIGFSEIAPSSLRRAAAVAHVDAVQSEYSLQTRAPELGLVQTCAALGTALVAFSPVGRGLLTDTPATAEKVAGLPFLRSNPRFQSPNFEANLAVLQGFRDLAAEMGEPTAALSIAWLLAQGDHVIPIPGTRHTAFFRELVRGTELTLSADDLARINAVLPVGWCHGDRYNAEQWEGPERYC